MSHDPDQPDNRTGGRSSGRDPDPARSRRAVSQHLDLDALNAYVDWTLDDADRRAAAAHFAVCRDCRRELAELRATVALLRGLPQYAARRSFRLGPEHATVARPGGRLARFLPALPALRVATAVVAVLLVAVIAGDLVSTSRNDRAGERAPALAAPTASVERPAPQEPPAALRSSQDEQAGAGGTESFGAASNRVEGTGSAVDAPAGVAQEAAPAVVIRTIEADAGAETDAPAARVASPAAGGDAEAAAPVGTAGDGGGPPTVAAPAPAQTDPPSVWRLAEVGLGLALLWLLVSVVGLQRLSRRA